MTNAGPLHNTADRIIFEEKFGVSLNIAQREGWHGALLYLELRYPDLDEVSKTTLLREIKARLVEQTRGGDVLTRLDNDDFVVWLQKTQVDQVLMVAERLQRRLQQPLEGVTGEDALPITVGIALYPYDGNALESLLARAHLAMQQGKSNGNTIQVFDPLTAS